MSVIRLFQRLNLKSCSAVAKQFCSAQNVSKIENTNLGSIISTNLVQNNWIYQQGDKIDSPLIKKPQVEIPKSVFSILPKSDPLERILEKSDPETVENQHEKQAVKLIVIRRHKMRVHKLKKLRKKMKFERAKQRQRREMKKEKEFQAGLISQIKEGEKFSAENYVANKIQEATEEKIPRYWKGKRLPEFIIREKLGLPPK